MATTNHFDLIVLGTDLPGLVCAALAAKRGQRVVVLPQGPAEGSVRLGGRAWRLDDAPLLGLSNPLSRRVFEELGLWAQIQRRRRRVPGHLHFALPNARIDIDEERPLRKEVERLWPEDPVLEALETLEQASLKAKGAVDELLESESVLSPEGFWARRFLNKATSQLRTATADPLAPLADTHPMRALASGALPWIQHLKPALLGQGAALRLVDRVIHTREDHTGGHADIRARLLELIRQKSGEYRPQVRVAELLVKRGRVSGVGLLAKDERYGCEQLVLATDPRRMIDAGLLPGPLPKPLRAALTDIKAFARRWIMHMIVRPEGLSPAFDGCVIALGESALDEGGMHNMYLRRRPTEEGKVLLTLTRIVPPEGELDDVREDSLTRLHEHGVLPFLRDHIELAWSPHDGQGATDGKGDLADALGPESTRRLPLSALFEAPQGSTLGVGLLPLSTGIKNLTFASRLTYPGLGLEGELLAGAAAAAKVAPPTPSRGGLFSRRSLS